MKKHALQNYHNNIELQLTDNNINNTKLYWKILRDTFITKPLSEIPPLQYTDSNSFSDVDKINSLNEYFASIACVDDDNSVLPQEIFMCDSIFDSMCINEQDIIDILSILPVNKAIGADLISHKMLKATKLTIVKPLFLLFNRSLKESVVPIMWKQANVIPLFKKDDPSV